MKNKQNLYFACILIVSLLLLALYVLMPSKNQLDNKLCIATINYSLKENEHEFNYRITQRIRYTLNDKGYINIRGVAALNDEQYVIARTVNFSYRAVDNNHNYSSEITNVSKAGQDNLPDALASQYISYLLPGSSTFFRMEDINNHLTLITAPQGPLFICRY
ncbi:FidL-like protein [Serratia oryzae]|uniref:FidL n=1 Tax=Serratia oryzae TaxID=2034155 RepID=A0A1S8CLP7_9GAMM|nr:FidL-like protein [Serratia oryzae]OMQ23682.1 hypothetical protein BMI79_09210 [Serratia oryzae]